MSHTVQVFVAINVEKEIHSLKKILQDIDSCAGIYKENFQAQIEQLQNETNRSIKYLQSLEKMKVIKDELLDYQSKVSTIMKNVANIKSSINYASVYSKLSKNADQQVNNIIKKHGLMAILAIENLENAGVALTAQTIESKIAENRLKKVEDKKLKIITQNVQLDFITSDLPDDVKSGLVKFVLEAKTHQELMDLVAFIATKKQEFKTMSETSKNTILALEEIGFKFKNKVHKMDEKGNITTIIKAYKDRTKDFTLSIHSNRKMEWQFGNYENHMCDSDGAKFRDEALPKFGIKTTTPIITRNISRSAPLRKARAMKLKEK